MKKEYFVLIWIALLSLFNLNAQNFAPIGATWYYNRPLYPYPVAVSYTKFESIKDTLVIGLNCKILQRYRPTNIYGTPQTEIVKYIFYSANNKVYTIENGLQQLLYDFTKNTGEYWLMPQNNDTVFVDSVKNIVLTNGQTRRVQYVHNYQQGGDLFFSGPVIENIGKTNYLLPYFSGSAPPEGDFMRCYYENGLLVHYTALPCDYQNVGIEPVRDDDNGIVIYNTSNGKLKIEIKDIKLLPLKSITIINNLGRKVYQKENAENPLIIIDLADIPSSFFIVKTEFSSNKIRIDKIVKL